MTDVTSAPTATPASGVVSTVESAAATAAMAAVVAAVTKAPVAPAVEAALAPAVEAAVTSVAPKVPVALAGVASGVVASELAKLSSDPATLGAAATALVADAAQLQQAMPAGQLTLGARLRVVAMWARNTGAANWVISRLQEKSTWAGILTAAATVTGITFSPQHATEIAEAGVLISTFLHVVMAEKPKA